MKSRGLFGLSKTKGELNDSEGETMGWDKTMVSFFSLVGEWRGKSIFASLSVRLTLFFRGFVAASAPMTADGLTMSDICTDGQLRTSYKYFL